MKKLTETVQTTVPKEQKPKEHKPRKVYSGIAVRFVLANGRINIFRELMNIANDSFNDDELPLSIDMEGLSTKIMDPSRVRMLDYFIHKSAFEEWWVHSLGKYPMVQPPTTVVLPIGEILYTIEKAGKDARAEYELQLVFATVAKRIQIEQRKPQNCPKCGKPTTRNLLPEGKRGKKKNRYKCECGWRGKVRVWMKKTRIHETTIEKELSKLTVTVQERDTEHWEIKPLEETVEDLPSQFSKRTAKPRWSQKRSRTNWRGYANAWKKSA